MRPRMRRWWGHNLPRMRRWWGHNLPCPDAAEEAAVVVAESAHGLAAQVEQEAASAASAGTASGTRQASAQEPQALAVVPSAHIAQAAAGAEADST